MMKTKKKLYERWSDVLKVYDTNKKQHPWINNQFGISCQNKQTDMTWGFSLI